MRRNSHRVSARLAGDEHQAGRTTGKRQGRREFLRWVTGLFTIGCGWQASVARAAEPASKSRELPNRASTSRASRDEAIRQIPFANLDEPIRTKIRNIVSNPTIYRRMPIEVVPCDPELYVFLVRYPEIVVNMWQLMGVTKVNISRTGPYAYDAQDGAGTVSKVQFVYGTDEKHLFLAEGHYEGPLLPRRVTGRCALLMQAGYSRDAAAVNYVSNRLDAFVQLDNVGAELVAKTLHPLMGKTADSNFSETMKFVGQVCHVAESNGPGVQRLTTRLDKVEPNVRARFAEIANTLNQRAIMREMAETSSMPEDRLGDLTGQRNVK